MKKLLFLFTIMACSFGMLNAANVQVRVLIPTDSEFSTSGDIVFSWKTGSSSTDILLTREGTSRWWGATAIIPDETKFTYEIYTNTSSSEKDYTFIMGSSPSEYVAKDKPELTLELMALQGLDPKGNRAFACGEVPATTEDHDYSITSWDVQDIGNGITVTWNAKNPAPKYYIEMLDDAHNFIDGNYHTVTEGKYTYHYTGTKDVKVAMVLFFPCYFDGTEMRPYVQMFQKTVDIDFKSPVSILKESLKAQQKDNTIEISWEHVDTVAKYEVYVEYGGEPLQNFMVLPQYMPATNGKYTLIVDDLPGNGAYNINFYAIDKDYNTIFNEYPGVTVTGLPALNEVELNVLIPSDNDMDISYGVWFQWWDVETETKAFVKADQDVDGVWFSKKITTDKSAIRFRVCNRSDASGSNSTDSPIIKTDKACFEMEYQNSHAWDLKEAACDAPDHDYRITNLQATSSGAFLNVEITAKDYAPYYQIEARKNGTGAYYQLLATLPYSGSNTVQLPVPFTETADYDYRITPKNKDYRQVAQEKEGTVHVTGNINIPTNLLATVATDDQTVTFTWTCSGTEVDHYSIIVDEHEYTNITGTSYTQKFYLYGYHYWSIYAYSSANVLIGMADCNDPFETITPDYDPKNLNVTVSGKTATFTWEAPEDVPACRIILYESGGIEAMNAVKSGSAGQFSTTYTLSEDRTVIYDHWVVKALTADGVAMSNDIYGLTFAIVGSTTTAIEEAKSQEPKAKSQKIIRNGQLYILYNGTMYNIQGQEVK